MNAAPSLLPSGAEDPLARELLAAVPGAFRTPLGSVAARFGPAGLRPRTLVLVPLDAPGFVVSAITGDGFLRLHGTWRKPPHPLHAQYLEGRPVRVLSGGEPPGIDGVVLARSTHLARGTPETPQAPPASLEDLWVDVGASSAEEAAARGIEVLDPVVPASGGVALSALRAGLAEAARRLAEDAPPAPVTLVWAAQESLGRKGAEEALALLGPFERAIYLEPDLPAGDAPEGAFLSTSRALPGARVVAAPELPPFVATAEREPAETEVVRAGPVTRHAWTPVEEVGAASLAALWAALFPRGESTAAALPGDRPPVPAPRGRDHEGLAATLDRLLRADGLSGHEGPVRDAVLSLLPSWARESATTDAAGNLIVRVGPEDAPLAALLIAHLDEIGYVVREVLPDGTARALRSGGFLDFLFEASPAAVLASSGPRPTAVLPRSGYREAALRDLPAEDVRVRAVEGMKPGDPVVFPKALLRLGPHRVSSRGLDDRAGCAALVEALRSLDPTEFARLRRRAVFAWSVREETGLHGARALSEAFRPAAVFPLDTFVSSDSPRESPRFAGARLGRGAVLRALDHSSATPRAARERALRIARERGIPVQAGVTGGGNDGAVFTRHGAVSVPLSWPLRSSHSMAEVADLRDLEALARLAAAMSLEF